MSYDTIKGRNERAERSAQAGQNDAERLAFLHQLSDAHADVTGWEANFIEATLQAEAELQSMKSFGASLATITFTDRQRATIDRMRQTYGGRL
jgi:hypothetical protein